MASPDDHLPPGTMFGGYQIERLVGEGMFGVVYEARSPSRPQPVAVKILRSEVSRDEEVVTRFYREAEAVARLRHPNIVEAIEVGGAEGRPFLAMELLVGVALGEWITRNAPVSLHRALDILVPVMSAIKSVHAQGIIHRDLKPDNIFLTFPWGETILPKVLDFGFAKFREPGMRITRPNTTIGTPNFMAPEQMHSPRSVDQRCDVWSLGVLLYYLLTGAKPFEAPTLVETLKAVLHAEPTPLRNRRPDLPPELDNVIHRALAKLPGARYFNVEELGQALLPFASEETALVYSEEFGVAARWEESENTNPLMAVADLAPPRAPVPPPVGSFPVVAASDASGLLSAYTPPPQPPAPPAAPVHSLQPVEAPRASERPSGASRTVQVALGVLGVGAMLVGGAVWLLGRDHDAPTQANPPPARDAGNDRGDGR